MDHVFISYKSQELKQAIAVRDRLRSWGYETWLDKDNLIDIERWHSEIDAALKASAAVVAIMSPIAIASRFVTGEWDIASLHNIPLLLLEHQPTSIYRKYEDVICLDFLDTDKVRAFDLLKETLSGVLANTSERETHEYQGYLETLYDQANAQVRQRTITSMATYGVEGQRMAEPLRLQAREGNTEVEPVDVGDLLFASEGHVLLLGKPGAGKTMALLNHARDTIVDTMHNPDTPLPVFAQISTWNADAQTSLVDWLSAQSNTPSNLTELMQSGKVLLLLDSLDELGHSRLLDPNKPAGARYDPRARFLGALHDIPAGNRILLTCREQEYAEIKENDFPFDTTLVMQQMSSSQIDQYLYGQNELKELIASDATLREVVETPLLLSFLAFAYEDMTQEERQQLTALQDSGALRDKIFISYIEKRYMFEQNRLNRSGESLPFSWEETFETLGRLAVADADEISTNLWYRASSATYFKMEDPKISPFFEMASRLNIIVNLPEEKYTTYHFFHTMLGETLAYIFAMRDITSEDSYRRGVATGALGAIRDRRAIDTLVSLLNDSDDIVSMKAASAFREMPDERALEGLVSLVQRVDKKHLAAPMAATYALGQIDHPLSFSTLVAELENKHSNVSRYAAMSLGDLGHAEAAIPLLNALKKRRYHGSDTLYSILEALVKIGAPAAEELLSVAFTGTKQQKFIARAALKRIRDPRVMEKFMLHLEPYLQMCIVRNWTRKHNKLNKTLRKVIVNGYGLNIEWNEEADDFILDEERFAHTLQCLKHEDWRVRACTALFLGRLHVHIPDPRCGHALEIAKNDDHPIVRCNVLDSLQRIDAKHFMELFIDALDDDDPDVRYVAILTLATLDDPDVIPHLVVSLLNDDYEVERIAANGLKHFGQQAIHFLAATTTLDNNKLCTQAAKVLAIFNRSEAEQPLVAFLEHADADIRAQACWSLSIIGGEIAQQALIESLNDNAETQQIVPGTPVCEVAAAALARIKTSEAKKAVKVFWRTYEYGQ